MGIKETDVREEFLIGLAKDNIAFCEMDECTEYRKFIAKFVSTTKNAEYMSLVDESPEYKAFEKGCEYSATIIHSGVTLMSVTILLIVLAITM